MTWNRLIAYLQGYLFDRRQAGRYLHEEWGVPPDSGSVVTCIRKFGRVSPKELDRDHITGTRMAKTNGYEVSIQYL